MTHRGVWYRSTPKQSRWRPIRAWEDKGLLVVSADGLAFRGRHGEVVLDHPRVISIGLSGVDSINTWITVEDRDGQRALFADGSLFGWGGVRGGTARLGADLDKAWASQPD
jgi:hypothetical protein